MKFRKQLLGSILIPLILFAIGIGYAIYTVQEDQYYFRHFLDNVLQRQLVISKTSRYLGYGQGIHSYKNYVIRGERQYADTARRTLNKSLSALEFYAQIDQMSPLEKSTIEVLKDTINQYLSKIEIAIKMHEQGKSVKEIDEAIKVDDGPAIAALDEYYRYFERLRLEKIRALKDHQSFTTTLVSISLIIAFIVAILFSRLLFNQFSHSVQKLINITHNISKGKTLDSKDLIVSFGENEFKELAEQLGKMSDNLHNSILDLEKSNEELEKFSFIASHDLQEPVKNISAFADLLEIQIRENNSDGELVYVEKIKRTSKKMLGMIQSLLEFASLKNKEINVEHIDFKDVVDSALEVLDIEIVNREAKIEIQPMPKVVGNKKLLEIVVLNLLKNSLKYTKVGVTPEISIKSEMVNSKKWKISVTDNGVGFDDARKNELIKPFTRLHLSKEYSGHGIGLSISHRILEAHDSRLDITSEPGVGSVFSFTLKAA